MTQAVALAQQASTGVSQGFKNRIINGAMVIDQRNAGASVSMTSGTFSVDRFRAFASVGSKMTAQQNAGSVTPPVGFVNYLGFTTTAGYTASASERFMMYQGIEGTNTADLGWGTANAKTVTLSFWVRSSLTGTHSGSLGNDSGDRSYVFTYTISAANTWEYKTITISGDTSGTWVTTSAGGGIYFYMNLGNGSSYLTTAGAWSAGYYLGATGSVSVVGTTGATLYFTGIQLEVGSTATSFDYRPYTTELSLCQRYAWKCGGATSDQYLAGTGAYFDNNIMYFGPIQHPVPMRVSVSMTSFGTPGIKLNGSPQTGFTFAVGVASNQGTWVEATKASHGITNSLVLNLNMATTSDYFIFSAEL